jgi:thiol-disulfide isomerase/thioredoxin
MNPKQLIFTFLFLALGFTKTFAFDGGYAIQISIKDYDKDTLYLAYYMGDKVYIKDTALFDKSSKTFTFKGEKSLSSGLYLLVLEGSVQHLNFIVSEAETQQFSLITQRDEPLKKIKLKNSSDNDIFFEYMNFIGTKTKEAETVKQEKDSVIRQNKFISLEKEVKSKQLSIISKYEKKGFSKFIKSTIDVEAPQYLDEKNVETRRYAQYYHIKEHYFDNTDLQHEFLLRTPTLFPKIDAYIEKLTPNHPDSIYQSLDFIFKKMTPKSEMFQFYFLHYFNKFATSNLVGFDAISTHLTREYIEKGLCDDFLSEQNRLKLIDNARRNFPVLIGKKAPNLKVFDLNQKPINLHDVKAKYTILYYYSITCGSCAKQSPQLAAFMKKMKAQNQDVKVITIGSDREEDMSKFKKYIEEKGLNDCINTIDAINSFRVNYDGFKTPTIYVLDENKVIRFKNIGAEQLEDVYDFMIKEEKEKMKKE